MERLSHCGACKIPWEENYWQTFEGILPTVAEKPFQGGMSMSQIELYRSWYQYEIDCNDKMLAMLASVPEERHHDARFQQAVTVADHLAACREKWLDFMMGKDVRPIAWWNPQSEFASLKTRFAALESQWTEYLAGLGDEQLPRNFEFTESNGESFSLPIEVQIFQLVGHAPYHRGQIALLVDQLGGETVDTDYADWWWSTQS